MKLKKLLQLNKVGWWERVKKMLPSNLKIFKFSLVSDKTKFVWVVLLFLVFNFLLVVWFKSDVIVTSKTVSNILADWNGKRVTTDWVLITNIYLVILTMVWLRFRAPIPQVYYQK